MAGAVAPGREGWSSRTAFVLAAIGAAVGLGNIWRFPTLAGENGGGAFVLVYIGCILLIGLPMGAAMPITVSSRSPKIRVSAKTGVFLAGSVFSTLS
jgi:hypothetical protein